jgi:hypothetical protein
LLHSRAPGRAPLAREARVQPQIFASNFFFIYYPNAIWGSSTFYFNSLFHGAVAATLRT